MTVAEFKAAREGLGMTQKRLAEALGFDVTTVSRIERNGLPVTRVVELAMHFLLRGRHAREAVDDMMKAGPYIPPLSALQLQDAIKMLHESWDQWIELSHDAIATIRFSLSMALAEAEQDVEIVAGTREEEDTKIRAGTLRNLVSTFEAVERVTVKMRGAG